MDEITLIQAAREGDENAYRRLFEDNRQRIFGLAYRYVRNREDAEDILQETFIKAYHSLGRFKMEGGTSFSSWIFRIGVNASIDLLRKHKPMKEHGADCDHLENLAGPSPGFDPEKSGRDREIRARVEEALGKLTPRQRMIFILKHNQEMSTAEIAEYMKCSQGSIKKQLFRAVSVVKAHFQKAVLEDSYEVQKI